ncbi:MAG TPA: OsmC family peroxiredoxin [Thermotogaceae bacterium]|nr:OsmC family peroxiredoxin [Thermotogaceae bacterium]
MSDLTFKVSAVSNGPGKTTVKARKFTMVIDEPPNLGGTDEGANPVEYLLAALAGCLNVVGHLVAKEMGIDIRALSMEISGTLNPDKLFGKTTTDRTGYKNINVVLKIDTDADENKLKEWIKTVEERCPVSDNLQHPTPIDISFEKKS